MSGTVLRLTMDEMDMLGLERPYATHPDDIAEVKAARAAWAASHPDRPVYWAKTIVRPLVALDATATPSASSRDLPRSRFAGDDQLIGRSPEGPE